jgi:hypothetical protein
VLNLLGTSNPLGSTGANYVVWGNAADWSNSYYIVWGNTIQAPRASTWSGATATFRRELHRVGKLTSGGER